MQVATVPIVINQQDIKLSNINDMNVIDTISILLISECETCFPITMLHKHRNCMFVNLPKKAAADSDVIIYSIPDCSDCILSKIAQFCNYYAADPISFSARKENFTDNWYNQFVKKLSLKEFNNARQVAHCSKIFPLAVLLDEHFYQQLFQKIKI